MRYTPLFVALGALACGGTSSNGSTGSPQAMNALAQDVSTAVSAYDALAAGMSSVADCSGDEGDYDAQVRPRITQMQDMGPQMDGMMTGSLGDPAHADMTCAADAMMAELDHHRSTACVSASDVGTNVIEAHRHVTVMMQWTDHELVRTSAMGSMMGGGMGGMQGGGMSTGRCVKNGDGSYSMQ